MQMIKIQHIILQTSQNSTLFNMNRRNRKLEISDQMPLSDDSQEEPKSESKQKKQHKATKKSGKNNTKKGSKRQSKQSQRIQQNQNNQQDSQIIQFRHGDNAVNDHIVPSFIRRWDGSNQLQIYPEELQDLTPMLKIYWNVKCKNMNTIIMVEVGREFMTLENDAIRMHQIFKKKMIKFSKFLMVYFWGKETEIAKKQLFDMKIPLMIMKEVDDPEFREKYGTVRREIAEVITPAIHLSYEDSVPRSRLMLAIYHCLSGFAVLILDCQSNHFFVQECTDDTYYHQLRRIINKYRPVELLVPKNHKQIAQIAKQICNPYINQIKIEEESIEDALTKFARNNPSQLFPFLVNLYNEEAKKQIKFSKFRVVNSLSLAWHHLQSLGLLEKIFFQGIFHLLQHNISNSLPFFDSQVYQNLQLFKLSSAQEETYAVKGTLMGFLDHCRTQQGRKLLHRWIDQPLVEIPSILERQQAVEQLLKHPILGQHQRFDHFAKFDKKIGDIYHWVSRNSEKGRLVLTNSIKYDKDYDPRKNPVVLKLKEIVNVLQLICKYEDLLREFSHLEVHSLLLKKNIDLKDTDVHNLSIDDISKLSSLPEISYIAKNILRRIVIDEVTGNVQPAEGQNQVFDSQKQELQRINQLLQLELTKWKEYFNTERVCFVSVKAKNQIHVPKMAIDKAKPHRDLIFSSEITAAIRYLTHQTQELSLEAAVHEKGLAESYEPFFQEIVEQFCQHKFLWDLHLQSMARIDVLISLAKAAQEMPHRCLPEFGKQLDIQQGLHANLIAILPDIASNSLRFKEDERVLLLTGPNMGGKSTFLKQVCVMAVLAQIGSYVPAQRYIAPIFDQIFCRMGASDRILEGKSTFYVELEETKRILSRATRNSLVVIDQLGRGTSTFDGMAIAEAILDMLIEQVQCITLYSTHYTQITEKFRCDPRVRLMKMGCEQENCTFSFTYQLMDGVAEKSFAGNVGKMVGLPQEILKKAEMRSQRMHEEIKLKKALRESFKLKDNLLSQ